GCLCFV
ncbi:aldo/keto reductase family protein, partial [Vibrio parahaemolyticus 970107]